MRVLVACEFSGIVRDAFIKRGHDAVSCDFLPTDRPGPHIQGDVLPHLNDGWDLMIAHPPCTHLSNSGARWFTEGVKDRRLQREALEFVRKLMDAPIERICIENPVGAISTVIRRADQIIDPYQFGHPETKHTCLWLKNLPLLRHGQQVQLAFHDNKPPTTNDVQTLMESLPPKERHRIWWMGSGHGKERSVTFQGIADAMADQWGLHH